MESAALASTPLPSLRSILNALLPTNQQPAPSAASSPPAPPCPPPHDHHTTLHVLFPGLLLPALDLIDRGLVTRLVPAILGSARVHNRQTYPTATTYLVRSLASRFLSSRRRPRGPAVDEFAEASEAPGAVFSDPHRYVVSPSAWNCSCAGFTADAFPKGDERCWAAMGAVVDRNEAGGAEHGAAEPVEREYDDAAESGEKEHDAAESAERCSAEREQDADVWRNTGLLGHGTFGGLSYDGTGSNGAGHGGDQQDAGVVPCCKHLLACVLAENWPETVGQHVRERAVTMEEMAGIIGGL